MEYFDYKDGPKPIGYYFDKIGLSFPFYLNDLIEYLPVEEIKKESKISNLIKRSYQTRQGWIMSKLEIVAPTTNCLQILKKYFPEPESYKISYLEIAKDTVFNSNSEAIFHYSRIDESLFKKYTREYKIFDRFYRKEDNRFKKDKSLISDWTSYYGRLFQYVIYSRLSKINAQPCFHEEWRIKRTDLIKKKANIFSFDDLLNFSFELFFKYQNDRFLDHGQIDPIKLGKWLKGIDRRRRFSYRRFLGIGSTAQVFLSTHNIHNFAGLVSFLAKEKKQFKSMPGKRTPYMKKVLQLRDYGKFKRKGGITAERDLEAL